MDKEVHSKQTIQKGMKEFIDREPARQRTQKDEEYGIVLPKLLRQSYGPFKPLHADDTTVAIEHNGTSGEFSKDRVTKVALTTAHRRMVTNRHHERTKGSTPYI